MINYIKQVSGFAGKNPDKIYLGLTRLGVSAHIYYVHTTKSKNYIFQGYSIEKSVMTLLPIEQLKHLRCLKFRNSLIIE